jgi:hypothetical protein
MLGELAQADDAALSLLIVQAKNRTAELRRNPAEAGRLALIDAAAKCGIACAVCGRPFVQAEPVVRVSHRAPRVNLAGDVADARYRVAATCVPCFESASSVGEGLSLAGYGDPVTAECVHCGRSVRTRTSIARRAPSCSEACRNARRTAIEAERRAAPPLRVCVECGSSFAGQRSAVTCSARCRQRAHRRRRR